MTAASRARTSSRTAQRASVRRSTPCSRWCMRSCVRSHIATRGAWAWRTLQRRPRPRGVPQVVDQSRADYKTAHIPRPRSLRCARAGRSRKGRAALKRGGDHQKITLDEEEIGVTISPRRCSCMKLNRLANCSLVSRAGRVPLLRWLTEERSPKRSKSRSARCSVTGRRRACCYGAHSIRELHVSRFTPNEWHQSNSHRSGVDAARTVALLLSRS